MTKKKKKKHSVSKTEKLYEKKLDKRLRRFDNFYRKLPAKSSKV